MQVKSRIGLASVAAVVIVVAGAIGLHEAEHQTPAQAETIVSSPQATVDEPRPVISVVPEAKVPEEPKPLVTIVPAPPQPVAPKQVSANAQPVAPTPPVTTPQQWVNQVATNAGIVPPVPIQVAPCFMPSSLGCTHVQWDKTGTVITGVIGITVDPSVIGTDQGVHVVLHELGHAAGIVSECGADAFAVAHGAPAGYHDFYCK